MPRSLLSHSDHAMRKLVGVHGANLANNFKAFLPASLLALWPSSKLGVSAGCFCFGSGRCLSTEMANQLADVYFVSTVRAFHSVNLRG